MKRYQRPDMAVYSGQHLKDVIRQDRPFKQEQQSQQDPNGEMPPFCITSAVASLGQNEEMLTHICITNAAPPVSAEAQSPAKTTCTTVAVPPRCLTNARPVCISGAVSQHRETAANPDVQG